MGICVLIWLLWQFKVYTAFVADEFACFNQNKCFSHKVEHFEGTWWFRAIVPVGL